MVAADQSGEAPWLSARSRTASTTASTPSSELVARAEATVRAFIALGLDNRAALGEGPEVVHRAVDGGADVVAYFSRLHLGAVDDDA